VPPLQPRASLISKISIIKNIYNQAVNIYGKKIQLIYTNLSGGVRYGKLEIPL